MNNITPKRIDNLDAIRMFAALSIALFHYTCQYPLFSSKDPIVNQGYLPLFEYGAQAIDLFFILSGFVIMLSAQKYDCMTFIKKRILRIYPSLIVCCSISFGVLYSVSYISSDATISTYLYNISLISFFSSHPFIDGAYWTLSYEFGFYIFVACFYIRFFKNSPHHFILYCISAAYLFYFFAPYIPSPLHLMLLCHQYAHIFAFGSIMYFWWENQQFSRYYIVYFMLILGINYLYNGSEDTLILILLMIITTILVFYKMPQNRLTQILVSSGQYSYPFYLLHQMIGFVIIYNLIELGIDSMMVIPITLSLIFIIAILVVKTVKCVMKSHKKGRI